MKIKTEIVLASITVALVLASILIGFWRVNQHKKIVTIDLKYLISSLAKDQNLKELPEEKFQRFSELYVISLNDLLKNLAEEEKLIIMPKQAVVAGSVDITTQVNELMQFKNTELKRLVEK